MRAVSFPVVDVVPVDFAVTRRALGSQVQVALSVRLEPVGAERGGECTTGDQRGLEEATRLEAQLVETLPARYRVDRCVN